MSRTQTPEYRAKYWKTWYAKNRQKHINHNAELNRTRRLAIKEMLAGIKLQSGCVDCGYREHSEALEFDHLDNKMFSLSKAQSLGYSKTRILEEIAKCEVVCANCHRIRTASRRLKL